MLADALWDEDELLPGASRAETSTPDYLPRDVSPTSPPSYGSESNCISDVQYTYDDWGNITAIDQDRDGKVASNYRTVAFATSLVGSADGAKRQRLQRDTTTLPNGAVVTSVFTGGTLNDEAGRVPKVQVTPPGGGATDVASYEYLGMGTVVTTALKTATADTLSRLHTGSSGPSYDTYMDRFGRVIKNTWTKNPGGGGGTVTLYGLDLTYDRNGNITSADDGVLNGGAGFDVKYAMDNLNRLVDADEGTLSTGSITSRTRREKWDGGGLSPTGNWLRHKLDLDGNGSYAGTGEMDDTGTFNKANEWLTRDLDSTPGTTGVRGEVSLTTIGNRKGYAGYEFDGATKQYHVRHRVYVPEMGRWTQRDPLDYVDGVSLYEYVTSEPVVFNDPLGLKARAPATPIPGSRRPKMRPGRVNPWNLLPDLIEPFLPTIAPGGDFDYGPPPATPDPTPRPSTHPLDGTGFGVSGEVRIPIGFVLITISCSASMVRCVECDRTLSTQVDIECCVYAGVAVPSSQSPATWRQPDIGGGPGFDNPPCATAIPCDLAGKNFKVCVVASAGWRGFSVGCRVCWSPATKKVEWQCGFNVAEGTQVSVGGCYKCSPFSGPRRSCISQM